MDNQLVNYIQNRKTEIASLIALDKQIGADPYDNIGRYKEVEAFEKVLSSNKIKNRSLESIISRNFTYIFTVLDRLFRKGVNK